MIHGIFWNILIVTKVSGRNLRRNYVEIYDTAATGGVLQEKVFLEILQNSQENICARVSFLIKLQASLQNCRTPFLQNTSGRLLLTLVSSQNYLSSFTQTVRKPWVKRDNKINFLLGGRVYTHSSHQGMHCIWN